MHSNQKSKLFGKNEMTELFLGVCFAVLIAVMAWGVTNTLWKIDAVERGLATYCPNDGEWAWAGECDE